VTDAAAPSDTVVADYRRLRDEAGAFVRPRDALRVFGPQAVEYLQGQCSQDVSALGVGDTAASLVLAPDGKLVALVRLTRTGPDEVIVDCDAGWGTVVAARLQRFKLRTKVEIEDLAWSCVAIRGRRAPAYEPPSDMAAGSLVLAVSDPGWEGYDVLGPAPAPPDGLPWCVSEAAEACRIETGIPLMGAELDDKTIPAEAHLVDRTVSFTKGCYTGQELVARLDARGNRVARRLCGLVVAEATVAPARLVGADLVPHDGEKSVGHLTSVAWCLGVGGPAGLGYVHRSVEIGDEVVVRPVTGPEDPGDRSAFPSGWPPAAAMIAQVRPLPLA
jgi:folate-binding protein YgfZ